MDRKDLSMEKSDLLKEAARKHWEKDAEKAGLGGMSITEAVHAAMFHPATAALPDPLVEEEPDDKDNWLLQAHRAGLMLDEDVEILGVEEGDGTGLAKVKSEPGEPGEAQPGEPGGGRARTLHAEEGASPQEASAFCASGESFDLLSMNPEQPSNWFCLCRAGRRAHGLKTSGCSSSACGRCGGRQPSTSGPSAS